MSAHAARSRRSTGSSSSGGEADEVLREVVAVLHETPSVGRNLVRRGRRPRARPAEGERTEEPVTDPDLLRDNVVAELGVSGGDSDQDVHSSNRCAELIAPYCLVGWDTGGEAWSP